MDSNQVNFWLSINAENFAPKALPVVKNRLEQMDKSQMMFLQTASFEKPSTIFFIALFLGWERFWLDDITLGIVKVITGYGCGIWWLIDIFTAKKRARKYNFKQFQKATVLVGNGTITQPAVTSGSSNADTPTTAQEFTLPTNKNNNSNNKIIVIVVTIAVLIGGGLAYRNWDSWFEPNVPKADISNLINSQMGNANSTTKSTMEDIFSESQKAKKTVEESAIAEGVVTEENLQTGQIHSINEGNNLSHSLADYLLTENDLRGLSKRDLRILRNEIYARHGYIFKSQDLREYFSTQDWYHAQYNDVSHLLNKIEKQNVEFIKRHE